MTVLPMAPCSSFQNSLQIYKYETRLTELVESFYLLKCKSMASRGYRRKCLPFTLVYSTESSTQYYLGTRSKSTRYSLEAVMRSAVWLAHSFLVAEIICIFYKQSLNRKYKNRCKKLRFTFYWLDFVTLTGFNDVEYDPRKLLRGSDLSEYPIPELSLLIY